MRSLICLLALCCLTGATLASDDLDFRPPAGWIHLPTKRGMEIWGSTDGTAAVIALKKMSKSRAPVLMANARICGNHPARAWSGPDRTGPEKMTMEGIDTDWGAVRYSTMYLRATGTAADPAAEASIRTLCLRKSR